MPCICLPTAIVGSLFIQIKRIPKTDAPTQHQATPPAPSSLLTLVCADCAADQNASPPAPESESGVVGLLDASSLFLLARPSIPATIFPAPDPPPPPPPPSPVAVAVSGLTRVLRRTLAVELTLLPLRTRSPRGRPFSGARPSRSAGVLERELWRECEAELSRRSDLRRELECFSGLRGSLSAVEREPPRA
jgi:hypothetical protein